MDDEGRNWLFENERRAIQGSLTLAEETNDPARSSSPGATSATATRTSRTTRTSARTR
jgi:hypothetical protein